MNTHTLEYVLAQDETHTVQLTVTYTHHYEAILALYPARWLAHDLLRVQGPGRRISVAQKDAQRFRTDAFHRFADQQLEDWRSGQMIHPLTQLREGSHESE